MYMYVNMYMYINAYVYVQLLHNRVTMAIHGYKSATSSSLLLFYKTKYIAAAIVSVIYNESYVL